MTTSVPPTLTKPNNDEEQQTSMAATVTTSLSPILTNPNDDEAKQTTLPAPLSPALIKLDKDEKETNLPTPLSPILIKPNDEEEKQTSLPTPLPLVVTKPNNEEEEKESVQELILSLPKAKGWITNYYYQYQGFWHMMTTAQGTIFAQKKFKFQPNDVLLATIPKSGTTWLKALAFAIKNRVLYHNSSSSTKTVTHPLLVSNPHALVPSIEYIPHFQKFTHEMDEIMKSTPRLLATHIPYNSLTESVDSSNFRLVYLCRDPKDVFVSLWHYLDKFDYKETPLISLQEAFGLFCDGVSYMGPYWDHVLGYYKASLEFPERVLFIKYEDMLTDTVNHVKRLAEFMGCPISLEEEEEGYIQEIVQLCRFENMKNLEVTRKGKLFGGQNNNLFYRNGVVGDSKNYLTPEMMEHIDQITSQKFQGYDIGY